MSHVTPVTARMFADAGCVNSLVAMLTSSVVGVQEQAALALKQLLMLDDDDVEGEGCSLTETAVGLGAIRYLLDMATSGATALMQAAGVDMMMMLMLMVMMMVMMVMMMVMMMMMMMMVMMMMTMVMIVMVIIIMTIMMRITMSMHCTHSCIHTQITNEMPPRRITCRNSGCCAFINSGGTLISAHWLTSARPFLVAAFTCVQYRTRVENGILV